MLSKNSKKIPQKSPTLKKEIYEKLGKK